METTIYRTGAMKLMPHEPETAESWERFDSRRPANHIRRQDALFAGADLEGGHRWMRSIAFSGFEPVFNAVTVESDNVRVYLVGHYNNVGNLMNGKAENSIRDYWDSGITLTEWKETIITDPYGEWEVMVPESEVLDSRVLSYAEMKELYVKNEITDHRYGYELCEEIRIKMGEPSEPSQWDED